MEPSHSNAQVSAEYLVISGFMLLAAGLLFAFSVFFFNENSSLVKAQDAVAKVANNANLVSSLGDGSKVYFQVELPNNVQSFTVSNNDVTIVLGTSSGNTDIVAYSNPKLSPQTLTKVVGVYSLSATYVDGNAVIGQ